MRLRVGIGVSLGVVAGLVLAYELKSGTHASPALAVVASAAHVRDAAAAPSEGEDKSPSLHAPTGKLASLKCADAATIVKEVRAELAFVPSEPTALEIGAATKDWLDPHGNWAVAPDAAPFAAIDADAPALLADISRGSDCAAALRIGRKLAAWVDGERVRFDARAKTAHGDANLALSDALDVAARDAGSVVMTATGLTDELADRAGTLTSTLGAHVDKYVQAARNRYFPEMTAEAWSEVVLAAAVRGWVEQVDAHGAWAPYGEEAAVHDVDLDEDAPSRLWGRATRTLLGARIDDAPLAPLAVGDVILDVSGMLLAGLAVEQLDELALTAADTGEAFDVVVMRDGDRAPRVVHIDPEGPAPSNGSTHPFDLVSETIPFGSGEVALVTIPDIYDDLGELFSRALARAHNPKLVGIVLDLRDDGGGSTEGAIDTLGAFLPGARLFPMRSRSGAVETDHAPVPAIDEQWTGPVATLVNGGTASAAEMLAGALAAYRRGPSVGTPTYGKGCAQEYVDDDAHVGLLRVTTLLFSLPDGSPVQRVGLTPAIAFPFHEADGDREAKVPRSPPTWTGPDVRDRAWTTKAAQFAWPSPAGHVGPCKEEAVCRALALLGDGRTPGRTASRTQR